jgi:hypothetical protein
VNGVYIYCITPPGYGPGPDLARFGPAPISGKPSIGLLLWVERLQACPDPSVEATLRHHAVVTSAWRSAPACLPVRFGQWFRDEAALEDRVEARRPELEAALRRVSEASEHSLRVLDPAEGQEETAEVPTPQPASGRRYLESVQHRVRRYEAREHKARALAEQVETHLKGVIRDQRVAPLPLGQGLVSLAHLVGKDHEEEYARRIDDFQNRHAELRFIRGGPWPPYSFAP